MPPGSPHARTPPGHDPRRGLDRLRETTSCYIVHQTGSGIVARALAGWDGIRGSAAEAVDRKALGYYTARRISAHYYIGLDGRIWTLTHEAVEAPHVGVSKAERRAYLSGSWALGERPIGRGFRGISPAAVGAWRAAWPRYRSPQHLLPSVRVTECSIGSEMAPAGYHERGRWRPLPGVVTWLGTRHTLRQHLAVALLATDIARRYDWPLGWQHDPLGGPRSPYLLGHEDVDLFGRANLGGGWDPGALRASPRWDWDLVRGAASGILQGTRLAKFILDALGGGRQNGPLTS